LPPCEHEDKKIKLPPLEDMVSRGVVAYLRVEKPRFLFLGGSTGVVATADVATATPRVTSAAQAGASAVRVGSPAARAASLMGCLATGTPAPAPGAISSAASVALGEGGAGSHLSERTRPPSLSSSSSNDEYSEVTGEENPCCSRSQNSSLFCSRRTRRRILFSFLRAACSYSHRSAARALGLGALAGQTAWRSRSPAAGNGRKVRPRQRDASKWRERIQKFHSPAGRGGA
jgi:hypothetical protein